MDLLRSCGVVTSLDQERQYLSSGVSDFAAYAHPSTDEEGLLTASLYITWVFLLDDMMDEGSGSAGGLHEMMRVVQGFPFREEQPVVRFFRHMWEQMTEDTPTDLLCRMRHAMTGQLYALLAQEADRAVGVLPGETLDEVIRIRREQGGIYPALCIAEKVGGYEVPPEVWHTGLLMHLRTIVIDHAVIANDIVSVGKEAVEEPSSTNTVAFLREHGESRPIQKAAELCDLLVELRGSGPARSWGVPEAGGGRGSSSAVCGGPSAVARRKRLLMLVGGAVPMTKGRVHAQQSTGRG